MCGGREFFCLICAFSSVYMYCTDVAIYLNVWSFLLDCLFVFCPFSIYFHLFHECECVSLCLCAHMYVCVSALVGFHQQSAAFNEGDGREINIVPLKTISSHPFIASHFHPFIVWESVWKPREREQI